MAERSTRGLGLSPAGLGKILYCTFRVTLSPSVRKINGQQQTVSAFEQTAIWGKAGKEMPWISIKLQPGGESHMIRTGSPLGDPVWWAWHEFFLSSLRGSNS